MDLQRLVRAGADPATLFLLAHTSTTHWRDYQGDEETVNSLLSSAGKSGSAPAFLGASVDLAEARLPVAFTEFTRDDCNDFIQEVCSASDSGPPSHSSTETARLLGLSESQLASQKSFPEVEFYNEQLKENGDLLQGRLPPFLPRGLTALAHHVLLDPWIRRRLYSSTPFFIPNARYFNSP